MPTARSKAASSRRLARRRDRWPHWTAKPILLLAAVDDERWWKRLEREHPECDR